MLGVSRKGMIGSLGHAPAPHDRMPGTLALTLSAVSTRRAMASCARRGTDRAGLGPVACGASAGSMSMGLFGTDGVRGRANAGNMTAETALRLGAAAGRYFRRTGDRAQHRVVIGKDTRQSGYMLETALTAGLTSTGMNVLLLGPVPTPAVGLLARSMRADLGVMISASHNPADDNGIKFFGPDGFKLSDAAEATIEDLVRNGVALADAPQIGQATRVDDGARTLCRIRQDDDPGRHVAGRDANRDRLRARGGVPRGPGCPVGIRGHDHTGRRLPERPQHQPVLWFDRHVRRCGRRAGTRGGSGDIAGRGCGPGDAAGCGWQCRGRRSDHGAVRRALGRGRSIERWHPGRDGHVQPGVGTVLAGPRHRVAPHEGRRPATSSKRCADRGSIWAANNPATSS